MVPRATDGCPGGRPNHRRDALRVPRQQRLRRRLNGALLLLRRRRTAVHAAAITGSAICKAAALSTPLAAASGVVCRARRLRLLCRVQL